MKAHFNSQTTALIVNPAAGGGRVGRRWKELESTIRANLGDIRIYLTQEIGDGIRLGEQAVRNGATTVLSLGGDGTHGEVLNGLMATEPADGTIRMGILHAGTGGDFRRMLVHSDSLERCMEHLSRAGSNPIDIGSVSYISDTGMPETRYFLNLASAGLAGHIDRMVNESKKTLWRQSHILFGHPPGPSRVQSPRNEPKNRRHRTGESPLHQYYGGQRSLGRRWYDVCARGPFGQRFA